MKKSSFIFGVLILSVICSISVFGQTKGDAPKKIYDAKLAEKLGADAYGMRSYVMVVLKTGANDAKITDKDKRAKLFAGHFSNMNRLAKKGKLVFAGPFMDGKPKRGLYIFAVKTIKEAEELVKTDPTVKAGIFVYEMTKLYGSAALMQVGDVHKTLQKTKIE